jgi:hypothetical protein
MLEALKNSSESRALVETAVKYLRGVKGTLVQKKKKDREKAMGIVHGAPVGNDVGGAVQHVPVHMATGNGVVGNGNAPRPGLVGLPGMPPAMQRPVQTLAPGGGAVDGAGASGGGSGVRLGGPDGTGMDEREVENALRGYLGK